MNREDLSDDAIRLWISFFRTRESTLRFGGDHAAMEITPRAREALDQLIDIGAVQTIPADDQHPNREHYGGTEMELFREVGKRSHLNPFQDKEEFVSFRKKGDTSFEAGQPSVIVALRSSGP